MITKGEASCTDLDGVDWRCIENCLKTGPLSFLTLRLPPECSPRCVPLLPVHMLCLPVLCMLFVTCMFLHDASDAFSTVSAV